MGTYDQYQGYAIYPISGNIPVSGTPGAVPPSTPCSRYSPSWVEVVATTVQESVHTHHTCWRSTVHTPWVAGDTIAHCT